MNDIVLQPLFTEKATSVTDKFNKYVFYVDVDINKIEIRKRVERFYNVNVLSVNIVSINFRKPKSKFTNKGVVTIRSKRRKKAILTLAKGEHIDLFQKQ